MARFAAAGEDRSYAAKREFQRERPWLSTGRTSGACAGYVKDHIVPLACRGPDTAANLQWQTVQAERTKERWGRKVAPALEHGAIDPAATGPTTTDAPSLPAAIYCGLAQVTEYPGVLSAWVTCEPRHRP